MDPDSILVSAGRRPGGLAPALERASVYETPPDAPFLYGRSHSPVVEELEAALGGLEDAEAIACATGMSAFAVLALTVLRPRDVLALPSAGYYEVQLVAQEVLGPFGVTARVYDPGRAGALADACHGARLVLVETPANPLMQVVDLRAAAAAAAEAGCLLVCDNTVATAVLQRPLDLGAQVTWQSGTKSLGGHSDALAGVLTTRDADLAVRLRAVRRMLGAILAPDPAWLVLRGVRTLALRVRREAATALALAGRLREHPAVVAVHYPGLPDDPGHTVAAAQMAGGFGSLLSFEVADADAADRALAAMTLVRNATSFGGVESTCERRSKVEPGRVPDGLLRLSVGVESEADLWEDLARGLASAATTG